mgnify:CR=1 FL=1
MKNKGAQQPLFKTTVRRILTFEKGEVPECEELEHIAQMFTDHQGYTQHGQLGHVFAERVLEYLAKRGVAFEYEPDPHMEKDVVEVKP